MVKCKILIIGSTSYIGKFIAQASVALGHPTYLLIRPATIKTKADVIDSFKTSGMIIVEGSLEDHGSLVAACKQVDVVICTVGAQQFHNQFNIISAIKEAGTIKRFLPSEFGNDVDRANGLAPLKPIFDVKAKVRRATEQAKIPYTYISCNSFAGYYLANLVQPGQTSPPTDKVVIHGDGNAKAIFVAEQDIATYTIKAVDDPKTLNKTLYIRPPANILSQNEVVTLWEKKVGKKLQKVFMSEEEIIKQVEATPFPDKASLAIIHSIFVKGDQYNFDIGPEGVEASKLYPEVKYTTADAYLNIFVAPKKSPCSACSGFIKRRIDSVFKPFQFHFKCPDA